MPKANAFVSLSKKLNALMIKSDKIHEDISVLVDLVQTELDKQVALAAPVNTIKNSKAPVGKKVAPTKAVAPKKGRPSKK